MTDEELKSNDQTKAFLNENGYTVKSVSKFMDLDDSNLEKVVSDLNAYKIEMNKKVTTEDFGKELASGLEEIENVVNSDNYFAMSANATEFKNLLDRLKNETKSVLGDYLKAEKILKEREENLKDIQRRVFALDKDQTLTDDERTEQAILLKKGLEKAKSDKEEALKFFEEQKRLAPEPKALSVDEIINYRNDLLKSLAELDRACSKIIMDPLSNPTTMEKLSSLIRNASYKIVIFGTDIERSKKEFDNLCDKYGLGVSNVKIKEKTEAPRMVEETKENIVTPNETIKPEISEEPLKEETTSEEKDTTNTITEVEDLVKELVRLNPGVNSVYSVDGYSEGIIVEDPTKLVIPDGFKYTEGLGINNKVNDTDPYINVFVQVKKKDRDIDSESLNQESSPEIKPEQDSQVKPEPKPETKSEEKSQTQSKIPSGKLAYKRTRRAIIAPYAKAILCYGGLGGIVMAAAGVGLSPVGAAMIIGSGIGAIGQKIYNKMIDNGKIELPDADLSDPNYELPVVGPDLLKRTGAKVVENAKALLKGLKRNKNKKKEKNLDQAPEVKADTDEKKTTLFENFKNLFGHSLDSEVDSLEAEKKEQPVERLDEIAGEEYDLDVDRGGRR